MLLQASKQLAVLKRQLPPAIQTHMNTLDHEMLPTKQAGNHNSGHLWLTSHCCVQHAPKHHNLDLLLLHLNKKLQP